MSSAVIIGAGPAGLSAAYELGKLGARATVLEADADVGGLARTVGYRGYRFDIGGHRFFSKVPLIRDLWREILGEDFLRRPRLSRIHYRGHYFDYPLKPLNALAGLGAVEALLVCLSYARAQAFPAKNETSFEQWVSNRFGQRLYEIFFKTYTEKVWGLPCAEISADWAVQRIKNLSLREAIRNALVSGGQTRDGEIISTLIDEFHYPSLGPGMMWERCADLVRGQGGQTICGVRVERVRHRNGRVEAVHARDDSGLPIDATGDHVVSTMAIRDLINCLDPAAPDEVRASANRLRYRDYLTIVLIVKRETVFPDNWIYIHSPEVKLGRVQNYKNWSPSMVPDAQRTSLGLEYFLWEHDEQWRWPDARLIEAGVDDCVKLGLVERGEVEDGTVVRALKAYPVYDRTYRDNVAIVRRYLETFENLQTIGRNGLHRYNNQDHSMLTGIYAARNIAGANHDVWSVNTEEEYLEEDAAAATSIERAVPMRLQPALAEAVIDQTFAHLDPVALGAAFGAVAGSGLLAATAFLVAKGGAVVGPNLSLLGNYLVGFEVSWAGAVVGGAQAALLGFGFGYALARLRNWVLQAYTWVIARRAAAEARRDLLDKV
jgi:protoporphyrinogen oxidase